MRILVTGAGGFIGRQVVESIRAHGLDPVCLVRTEYSHASSTAPEIVVADLSKAIPKLPEDIDAIVHAAARSPDKGVVVRDYIADNVVGTDNLMSAAVRTRCRNLVFLSSISVYGDVEVTEVDENTEVRSPGPYGTSKYVCEQLLESFKESLSIVALRLPGVIGRGAKRPWLARLVRDVRAGVDITIYNPDAAFNNAVDIGDLCSFTTQLVAREGLPGFDVLTLAAQGTMTVKEMAESIRRCCNKKVAVSTLPAPQRSFIISTQRAIREYGYSPTDMTTMLETYIEDQCMS